MRKIDAFKRELPLCMVLINDAIVALKEEVMVLRKKAKLANSGPKSFEEVLYQAPYTNHGLYKGCGGITMVDTRQELSVPDLSLITPGIDDSARGGLVLAKSSTDSKLVSSAPNGQSNVRADVPQCQPPHQQTSRKQRRCWSSELHRRFVNALQQLGGSQAATPKQIRELMQVDGLTNDEVKSHLQKYRLHTRRLPSSNTSSANQSGVGLGGGLWMSPQDQYVESSKQGISQSGSPDGPLLIGTTGGTSTTGDNSMDDGEDSKSENYSWKGHLDV
ncbi:Homeodomain-like protein [Artemisia annua]|uniref:Homeodomain-like protein n=1 Tax=Artemisia annua TaxID=35608 RepID=A0A2U1NT25_ARTAN|nr:Homeodomain-like protein [Artemisia annua]